MRFATALLFLTCSGCGRYAEFALPAPKPDGPESLQVTGPLRGDPVLKRGAEGEWDSVDVLNPAVFEFGGRRWMLYSGFDGKTWRTGAAIEENGTWVKQGVVLSPEGWEGRYIAANGSALVTADEILYWYQAGDPPRIALARSRDGRSWVKHPNAVLLTGPRGAFDERGVADAYVIRAEDQFYMFYLGQDRARRQRLGVARSADGIEWVKLRSNPILELGEPGAFDENGVGEPAVWTSGGSWWMLYTGRNHSEERRIGLARSADGAHWQRDSSFAPLSGSEPWNNKVVCDPHVEVIGGSIRLWYGGGDQPRPAENLNGQIGVVGLD